MANINDYLLWRGDIPINEEFRFNEIDSIILARFSYLIFDKIEMNEKETIESISKKMKDFENEEFRYNGDKELITYLGESKRFKNMIVTDYVQTNDKEIEQQFGAITIHISEEEMYISYIGTDSSIYGWKEDFNMAFMENVPCQKEGKKYIEKIAQKYPNKKIRIGGHSKGGNVAIYSAITTSKKLKNRIIKVYNYDGPGFNKNIINKYNNDEIISKIETYIPQDSIIGRLLNHKEKMTIALSLEKGILQHDIYSWQVLRDDLIHSEKNTDISEDIDKTMTEWIELTTNEQRKIVIDAIFELFYSTDSETFGEMSKNISINLPKILKKYGEIAKEDKEMIKQMIKIIATSYINIFSQREKSKLDDIKKDYINKTKLNMEVWDKKYFGKLKNTI